MAQHTVNSMYDPNLLRMAAQNIVFFLRDLFLTDEANPLTSPRSAEPGPGSLTIVDNDSAMSIDSDKLVFAYPVGANGNQAISAAMLDGRYPGLCSAAKLERTELYSLVDTITFGCNTDLLYYPDRGAIAEIGEERKDLYELGSSSVTVYTDPITVDTPYIAYIIRRSSGNFYLYKIDGIIKLYWIRSYDTLESGQYLVLSLRAGGSAGAYLYCRKIVQSLLPGPWNSDYGIATERIEAADPGDTITHESDCLAESTWTGATGEIYELSIRRSDASNAWVIQADESANRMRLIERVGGSDTIRSDAAATIANGVDYRILVMADDEHIRTHINFQARNDYTFASFNKTKIEAHTNKSVSEFISWPRVITGRAAYVLNRVIN